MTTLTPYSQAVLDFVAPTVDEYIPALKRLHRDGWRTLLLTPFDELASAVVHAIAAAGLESKSIVRDWYFPSGVSTHFPLGDFIRQLEIEGWARGGAGPPLFSTPVLFMYRNPLDIVVSESRWIGQADKTAMACYLTGVIARPWVGRRDDEGHLVAAVEAEALGGLSPAAPGCHGRTRVRRRRSLRARLRAASGRVVPASVARDVATRIIGPAVRLDRGHGSDSHRQFA